MLLMVCALAACATAPPRFRNEALDLMQRLKTKGGESLLPAEFNSAMQAFRTGEALTKEEEEDEAEEYYYLALMKGTLLDKELHEEKARRKEAARRAEEQKKAELERRAQEESKRLAQARAEALAPKDAGEAARKKAKALKEHPLVSSYTVKRGESLPLIASQPEVYGDRNLWPLIYRANRDQISDPRHIWPGQVLRVPRNNLGREDLAEAKRYAQDKPLH
jgi:nucleoid-associated protein YgaU